MAGTYQLIKITKAAADSLLQQKLRSFLSVLGVVCGVMAVIAMIAIGEGAKQETLRQIEQLGTRNIYIRAVPQSPDQMINSRRQLSRGLNLSDAAQIKSGCRAVEAVAALKEVTTPVLDLDPKIVPQVVASSENYSELLGISISAGRFIVTLDRRHQNLVCVLGDEVARRMGELGKIGAHIRMADQLVKVVGILNRTQPTAGGKNATISMRNPNEMIFVPLESASTLDRGGVTAGQGMAHGQVLSEIVIQVKDTELVQSAAALVKRIMALAHHQARDYQTVVPLELLRQAERTQRTLSLVLGTIAAISLLVGGIGIMNIMLATVSERIREIGIRRAVGATRRDILVQFLAEAVLLTGAGGIIGLGGGLTLVLLFSTLSGFQMAISFWGVFLPLQLSFLVGIFFGLYPAKEAARVDPMVALRHQ